MNKDKDLRPIWALIALSFLLVTAFDIYLKSVSHKKDAGDLLVTYRAIQEGLVRGVDDPGFIDAYRRLASRVGPQKAEHLIYCLSQFPLSQDTGRPVEIPAYRRFKRECSDFFQTFEDSGVPNDKSIFL